MVAVQREPMQGSVASQVHPNADHPICGEPSKDMVTKGGSK